MLEQILFYLFGAFASAGFIASNYTIKKERVLLFQSFGSIAVSIQFALIDVYAVAAVNAIFLIRNFILFMIERQDEVKRPARYLSTVAVFSLATLTLVHFSLNPIPSLNDFSALAAFALPFSAGLFNIIALAQKNLVALKWFIFVSASSWAAFDIINGAWTTLVGDTFSMLACLVAIYRIKKEERLR